MTSSKVDCKPTIARDRDYHPPRRITLLPPSIVSLLWYSSGKEGTEYDQSPRLKQLMLASHDFYHQLGVFDQDVVDARLGRR